MSCFGLSSWSYLQTISRLCWQGKFLQCRSPHTWHLRGRQLNKQWFTGLDQIFFVVVVFHLQTDGLLNSYHGSLDLLLKRLAFNVGANSQMGVTSPRINSLLVKRTSKVKSFTSGSVVLKSIEFLCSVSSRIKEDDSVISSVSQSDPAPAFLVHNGLELLLGDVSGGIDCSSIAEHDRGRFAHFCQSCEVIFRVHLEPDQQTLELDSFLDVELGHENHATRMNDHSGNLGHHEYSESFFGEIVVNFSEGCALAGTGSSSNCDFVDRMFSVISEWGLFDVIFEVDLVESIFEFLHSRIFRLNRSQEEVLQLFLFLVLLVKQVSRTGDGCQKERLNFIAGDLLNNITHRYYTTQSTSM